MQAFDVLDLRLLEEADVRVTCHGVRAMPWYSGQAMASIDAYCFACLGKHW